MLFKDLSSFVVLFLRIYLFLHDHCLKMTTLVNVLLSFASPCASVYNYRLLRLTAMGLV